MNGGDGDLLGGRASGEPRWRRHLCWAAVALAYLIVSPYFAALHSPNENVRVWTTHALVAQGTFAVEGVEERWGAVADLAAHAGHHYSSKAPGTSLLGVPVHFAHHRLSRLLTGRAPSPRATTFVLRAFTVAIPLGLFLLVFARRVEAVTRSPEARDLLVVGLGLGTLFYPYGLSFVGHAQSAALLFTGFLFVAPTAASPIAADGDARVPGILPRRLLAAGALTGLAVVFEYQALFAAAVVGGYALFLHRRRALAFALGALAPAALLMAYHAALFGSPFSLPYAHLGDAAFQSQHHAQGFLGLGRPQAAALRAAFFDVDYGLFVFSPFLAAGAAVAFLAAIGSGSHAHVAVLAVTGVMGIFLSGLSNWRGGWCAGGPRYIATVVPFLAFGLALGWRSWLERRWWAVPVLRGLVLASVVLCVLSGALFPHFPIQFRNPVFGLVLPLLAEGFAPHGLGTLLGLSGLAAHAPLALVVLVALGAAFAHASSPRGRGLVLSLAVAAALLGPLSRAASRPTPDERHALEFVRSVWEPSAKGTKGGGAHGDL